VKEGEDAKVDAELAASTVEPEAETTPTEEAASVEPK
jgi:hypothetical protein